jgi:tRNA (guanine26-N2/guanine27-N2)-dimethyltransferase
MQLKKEGSVEFYCPEGEKVSKELLVFYNPVMKFNRDITILLLKQFAPMQLCDPLAGTGIRAIRFARELKYKAIVANDLSKASYSLIRKNMRYNKVHFELHNEDASMLLLKSKGFDYIDLDVFGSPNFVLDAAVKRISRDGILAVTATDTACLSGTFPKTCQRKYWAKPLKNELMHELGLRILIRKVQLVAAQYDKALTPIFSYFHEHYFRVFLQCHKGKSHVDALLQKHGCFKEAGPLWLGQLWDKRLVAKMNDPEHNKFLEIIKKEAAIDTIGFYHLSKFVKRNKLKAVPRKELILSEIKKQGYKAAETHFNPEALRTDMPEEKLIELISKLNQ